MGSSCTSRVHLQHHDALARNVSRQEGREIGREFMVVQLNMCFFLPVWSLLTVEFQVSFAPILSFSSCAMTGCISFISPWVV